jgi:G3E family GTPase
MESSGIDVYLISGFLGSGKTTFLNHMLKDTPSEIKLLVLMNEFGEESIDGELVEDPELDMVEISKGSIFCACVKGDFIKALHRIAFTIQPDVLVIEASGVANPTDIGRDLFNQIFKKAFSSLEKVCLLDSDNFMEQYEIFTAIEKQIEAADKFIINKIDISNPENINKIKETVLSHNPNAEFEETTFGKVDLHKLFSRLPQRDTAAKVLPTSAINDEELEELVDKILEDEAGQVAPPDALISITCKWIEGSLQKFQDLASSIPDDIVRGKGFIFDNGQTYLYSHVGHAFTIEPFNGSRLRNTSLNRVVFIRREFQDGDIKNMFAEHGLKLVS